MQNILYEKQHLILCKKISLCAAIKSLVATFLVLLFALSACFSPLLFNAKEVFASSVNTEKRVIRAGVFHFEGYHMKDENGKYTGYGIKFLNLVSEYSRLHFDYVGFDEDWSGMMEMLKNGDIDVVTSASRDKEREKDFAFSLPIGRKKTVLSTKFGNTQIIHGNYSTYNDITIGVIKDSSQNDILKEFAQKKGFVYTEKVYGKDDNGKDMLSQALQKGEVDAILSSNLRKAKNEESLDIIAEDDFYAMVRKEDVALLEELNYGIKQMNINEGDWQNVLFYQFYDPEYQSALSFTEREKEYLRQVVSGEKTISVTARGDRAPYAYTENGQLKGIIPDYFDKVIKIAEVGIDMGNIPYCVVTPKDKDEYNNLIANSDVNVVLDSVENDGFAENTFHSGFRTDSYMSASLAMVMRTDFKGVAKTVAVAEVHGKDELMRRNLLDGYEVKEYSTGEDALRAVRDKKADVAYVYAYTAQLFISRDKTSSLYYNVMQNMRAEVRMLILENTDHELISILNKCIKQLPDDTLNQVALRYVSFTAEDTGVWEYLQAHPEIIIIICIAVMLAAGAILALYLRSRWNRKLFHTTEQSNIKIGEQLAIVEGLSRDYVNVFAINKQSGMASIIKLEGYVVEGLKKDSAEEYDYAAFVGKYIGSRVHADDRERLTQELSLENVNQKLEAAVEYLGSYRITVDGEVHHFQYAFFKITKGIAGYNSGVILVGFRNIDDIIRKEQEQQKALSEALVQAQYANKSKTAFLNNMSHDIRTPMNAIIGFTSLAVTHIDNKAQIKEYLSKILTSSNHLLSLINDVLDMSRIESGKVNIEEKEVSLPEILHDLKTIVQADVKSKQLEFFIDTLDVTNETVFCDKLRLNQVLLNILSNAMKYTNPGGMVSVRVVQSASVTEGRANYEFRVKDSGIGMSKEFLLHVFEPFEREQTSTVSGIQGTGLGLAITKNIVDMMGGTISVESELGKGTEFIVKLCLRVADNSPEPQRLEQLENLRALVVDDDVNTCVSVSKMLSTIGMRPDWTTLGNEAIIRSEFAKEQNEPYSAYIIDWLMPDMNGIELVRRIRKKIGDDIPVIILTAYDWSDIEAEAREAGVTAFCSKPIFLSELRHVLYAPFKELKKEEKKEETNVRFDNMKLLLVEDNEFNQEIAQTILEGAGFIVDTADDGSVALEQIKNTVAGTYDLILMDVQMPIMNGYEATKAIRALDNPRKAGIPIVAMTANAFAEDRKAAMDSGMNGHLAKPIDVDKLMALLKEILK